MFYRPPIRTAIQLYEADSGKLITETEFPGLLSFPSSVPGSEEIAASGDDGRSLYFFSLPDLKVTRSVRFPTEHPDQGIQPWFVDAHTILYFSGSSSVDKTELLRFSLSTGTVEWMVRDIEPFRFLWVHLASTDLSGKPTIAVVYGDGPVKGGFLNRDVRIRALSVRDGKVTGSLLLTPAPSGDSAILRHQDGSEILVEF
jgi:hypothetical protein